MSTYSEYQKSQRGSEERGRIIARVNAAKKFGPGSKAELIALAAAATVPVTRLPTGFAKGVGECEITRASNGIRK